MQILDGKALSKKIEDQVANDVKTLKEETGRTPGLAVILVGSDPASQAYVGMKKKACDRVGFYSVTHEMPADISQDAIENTISMMNQNPSIDGILIQLPLPEQIDTTKLLELVAPNKDVDGFHPYNLGRLAQRKPALRPCTPYGVKLLLDSTGEPYKGRNAVIVGASNHVGRPASLELLLAGATVTTTHRFTSDLEEHVRRSDIVVVAVGKPGLVKGEWIKEGATVIDVGINRQEDGTLCGDVNFAEASKHAAWITPVPGGVGPMTVAVLMLNTLDAADKLG